ncbi:O-antigen ligase family protein [Nocardioides sp. W7]|uniref:O-antigen ligase family protein n=1 Tax=Nocardioides sp. W7 TaxID=2931390 RepID=UPI001FD1917F|nr:O-antigen ligase family protein [Nocardioides sp. W7]
MTVLARPVEFDGPRGVRPSRRVLTLGAGTLFGALAGLVLAAAGLVLGPWGPVALVALPAVAVAAWRAPHLVVVGVILLLPLGNVVVGPLELVQLGTAVAAVAVLAPAAARLDWRLPPWPVAVPLGAFAIVAALASAGAASAAAALRLDVQLLLVLLLTVAVTTALRTPAQVRLAVVALVVAGGLASLPAVLGSGPTESHYGGGVVTGRAEGVFAQPNELGLFSALLLVAAVGVGLTATTTRLRVTCLASGGLLLTTLALSLSRGAWLGAVAGLVALAVLVPESRRALAVLGSALLAVGAVLAAFGVGPIAAVVTRATSVAESGANPYDQRPLIWEEALRLYAEAPILGHGPGAFSQEASSDALRLGAFLDVDHAHHLLLNVAVEFGAAGLLALLGLMVGLLVLVRRGRAAGSSLPAVLAAASVVVVAHGMVDYPLRNPLVLTTVWVVLGLLVAAAAAATATSADGSGESR